MRRRPLVRLALSVPLLALACLGAAGCVVKPTPPFRVVSGGASASNEHLWVCGPNWVARGGRPSLAYGLVDGGPWGGRRFAYFVVLKPDLPKPQAFRPYYAGASSGGNATLTPPKGRIEQTISQSGSKVRIAYTIEAAEGKPAPRETIAIDGHPYSIGAGRVFLLDLGTSPATVTQVRADLPPNPDKPAAPEMVESLADMALASLENADPTVRQFTRQ